MSKLSAGNYQGVINDAIKYLTLIETIIAGFEHHAQVMDDAGHTDRAAAIRSEAAQATEHLDNARSAVKTFANADFGAVAGKVTKAKS